MLTDCLFYFCLFLLPPVSTPCSANDGKGDCSSFCLPKPSGYSCGCADGQYLADDGVSCTTEKQSGMYR